MFYDRWERATMTFVLPASCSSFILHPSSFILHPSSFILHPSSFILHPSSFILHPSSFILHPSAFILHPCHFILHPSAFILALSSLSFLHSPHQQYRGPQKQQGGKDRAEKRRPGIEQSEVAKQPVSKMEAQPQHDAGKDLAAQPAIANLEIGERQCQYHHHQNREGVNELRPQYDLVA